ncbi:hypothetical protein CNEO2_280035 [Clostridium neonatale]|nr:hypothetical protein CNEO2_280035 [Clostridium neonatale]CAI3657130.1 hypothetical protein CNEO4_360022 [Clostridium neonatale]
MNVFKLLLDYGSIIFMCIIFAHYVELAINNKNKSLLKLKDSL